MLDGDHLEYALYIPMLTDDPDTDFITVYYLIYYNTDDAAMANDYEEIADKIKDSIKIVDPSEPFTP